MAGPLKILVVDDDGGFVSSLATNLRSAGFKINTATDGIRAVEKAIKTKPDLILLDWRLPGGTGKWVYTTLQEHPETSLIPIIVLSAFDKPVAGGQQFLQKPFEPGILIRKIKTVLYEHGFRV